MRFAALGAVWRAVRAGHRPGTPGIGERLQVAPAPRRARPSSAGTPAPAGLRLLAMAAGRRLRAVAGRPGPGAVRPAARAGRRRVRGRLAGRDRPARDRAVPGLGAAASTTSSPARSCASPRSPPAAYPQVGPVVPPSTAAGWPPARLGAPRPESAHDPSHRAPRSSKPLPCATSSPRVPFQCGFHPRRSVVVLSLRGPRMRVGQVTRADLPAAGGHRRTPLAELAAFVVRDRGSASMVVVYDEQPWDRASSRRTWAWSRRCSESCRPRTSRPWTRCTSRRPLLVLPVPRPGLLPGRGRAGGRGDEQPGGRGVRPRRPGAAAGPGGAGGPGPPEPAAARRRRRPTAPGAGSVPTRPDIDDALDRGDRPASTAGPAEAVLRQRTEAAARRPGPAAPGYLSRRSS